MEYRTLGRSGMRASVVGLGTWVTGGGLTWGEEPDDRESIRAIQASIDAGINLIDTAPAYGWGRSERVVAAAIKGRREKVILATKCGLIWDDERGSPFAELDRKLLRRSLRPDTIREEIERSLERLETDRIDLYQTHWPSIPPDQTSIADTMACLTALKDEGKIRAIGVCNVTLPELKENLAHGEVASDQFHYSLLFRSPESDILPFCRKNGIATLTYMSLEHGLLTGKVGMDRSFQVGEFRSNQAWNPWFKLENRKGVLDLLAGWKDLTEKHRCTLAQLVIAWTAAQPGVTHVLAGARRTDQALENARGGSLKLEAADIARIRRDVKALGDPTSATDRAIEERSKMA